MRTLTPLEARVLAVLIEKQHTVPDTYPLSLNSLTAGCNQKTARSPVIEATEAEVLTAVDGLKALSLVFEGSGSRVVKFEHNMGRVLGLPSQAVALLTVLMLRGAADLGRAAPEQRAAAQVCGHLVGRGFPGGACRQGPGARGPAGARPWCTRAALGPSLVR